MLHRHNLFRVAAIAGVSVAIAMGAPTGASAQFCPPGLAKKGSCLPPGLLKRVKDDDQGKIKYKYKHKEKSKDKSDHEDDGDKHRKSKVKLQVKSREKHGDNDASIKLDVRGENAARAIQQITQQLQATRQAPAPAPGPAARNTENHDTVVQTRTEVENEAVVEQNSKDQQALKQVIQRARISDIPIGNEQVLTVGDPLDRNRVIVLENPELYGLPGYQDDWRYYLIDDFIVRADPTDLTVLEIVGAVSALLR
ncbi:hypothetical protein [Brevirhabdus sp.]|uniref:hypothetical protein n=1 Tax=Brevirhabdus sp. TaxID=2004514 RepID=UPI004057F8E4